MGIVDTGKFSFRSNALHSNFCMTFRYLTVMGTREEMSCSQNAILDLVHGNIRLSTLQSTSAHFQSVKLNALYKLNDMPSTDLQVGMLQQ